MFNCYVMLCCVFVSLWHSYIILSCNDYYLTMKVIKTSHVIYQINRNFMNQYFRVLLHCTDEPILDKLIELIIWIKWMFLIRLLHHVHFTDFTSTCNSNYSLQIFFIKTFHPQILQWFYKNDSVLRISETKE